ncbi:MAG: 4'-phosphopantetheinyl transferase superfamily protein [Alphaproteobacteria bacterium]|nr:4'-phosphopantetheinyl transferase superfamily protein [Silvanigrellaceae bacterium]MBX9787254.1 4'-phosphopantetheinyl transferase superfamily protein [Alphaproteobacteria bacterium]
MDKKICVYELTLPFSNTFFKSYFCLASLSCEFLTTWKEKHLHSFELLQYESITNNRRKHDYLLRNYCAKRVVLSCLKKPLTHAKHINIDKDMNKSAILAKDRLYYSHLQISVTHSETLGFAVAFEGLYPLGIDVERINMQKAENIESLLVDDEKKIIQTILDKKEIRTTVLWTAKESLCKALGGGLAVFSEITQIIGVFPTQSYTEILFKHFPGFRAYSFLFEDYIITITFPYTKRFEIDLHQIWQKFKEEMYYAPQNLDFWNLSTRQRKIASNS